MSALQAMSPVVRGVRMFVAPVDRESGTPLVFDPAAKGRFELDAVHEGWFDLGCVAGLERASETTFTGVWSGAPALMKTRARSKIAAGLRCTFAGWSRLALALSSGSACMNLLRVGTAAAHTDSGGTAEPGIPVLAGSTATLLQLPAGSAVQAGDLVVVDEDYAGQTGYVGAVIAGGYVASPDAVANSVDYVRRVSFNVGRVVSVQAATSALVVTLASPLFAGTPTASMKLAVVEGFVDRVGGSFVSEWSVLLVMDGVQGDRVLLHYPRVQSAGAKPEESSDVAAGLQRVRLQAELHALPVTDPNDGEAVLCYRSYLPASGRLP